MVNPDDARGEIAELVDWQLTESPQAQREGHKTAIPTMDYTRRDAL